MPSHPFQLRDFTRLTAVAVVILAASTVHGQPAGDQTAAVARIFSRFTAETPGCAVGVAERGAVVFRGGYGLADLERGVPIRPETVFESGSVAKQFTAATLLLLEQQRRLSLDDPLRKQLPELPEYRQPVTIRHVIHHTSGLREWRLIATLDGAPEGTRVYRNLDLLQLAGRQKGLNFEPGARYSYSNTGFNIATILIERAAGDGRTFPQITADLIFRPLGMSHTRWRDNFRDVIPGRALAYSRSGSTWVNATPIENIIGAGGLLTTVEDLLRWNENFTHARVGGQGLLEAQLQLGRLVDGRQISYAAGLQVNQWEGIAEVAHSGATGGYRTWLGRYPGKAVSVAVLCNSADADATHLGRETARLWTRTTPAAKSAPRWATADDAAGLIGTYRNRRDNSAQMLEVQNGEVRFGTTRLARLEPGRFGLGAGTLIAAAGPVTRLQQPSPMGDIEWERVERSDLGLEQLAALAGTYETPETLMPILVAISSSGTLSAQLGREPASPLEPLYKDAFKTARGIVLRFERDSAGRARGLTASDARTWNVAFVKRTP